MIHEFDSPPENVSNSRLEIYRNFAKFPDVITHLKNYIPDGGISFLITDVDGTLRPQEIGFLHAVVNHIPDENIHPLIEMKKNGVKVVVVSNQSLHVLHKISGLLAKSNHRFYFPDGFTDVDIPVFGGGIMAPVSELLGRGYKTSPRAVSELTNWMVQQENVEWQDESAHIIGIGNSQQDTQYYVQIFSFLQKRMKFNGRFLIFELKTNHLDSGDYEYFEHATVLGSPFEQRVTQ